MLKKLIISIIFFIIFICSCKNQTKTEIKTEVNVKINVLNSVNSTKIVEGSTLYVYEMNEKEPCISPIMIKGESIIVSLKKNKQYDFVVSGTEFLTSSVIKNFKLNDAINEINIIQLDRQLPDRITTAPILTKLYATIQNKEVELKDGVSLNLPLKAKIYANVFSYEGAITKLFHGGISTKLGFEVSPSSITRKGHTFLSGLNPIEIKNIEKGNGWENIFEFNLNTHNMGLKSEVDFILVSYDVVGNRMEHHTYIRFNDMESYKEYPNKDIKIKDICCNVKTTYSSINLYSTQQEKQNIYYFPNFTFNVEDKYAVEIYGMQLFRRNKKDNSNFIKVSEVLYDRKKLHPHLIVDTYGGLNIEKEYEYKIRVLLKN
ncbi:MAG: hypothetical protein ACTTKH_08320, partial [Treponema sp.]